MIGGINLVGIYLHNALILCTALRSLEGHVSLNVGYLGSARFVRCAHPVPSNTMKTIGQAPPLHMGRPERLVCAALCIRP